MGDDRTNQFQIIVQYEAKMRLMKMMHESGVIPLLL